MEHRYTPQALMDFAAGVFAALDVPSEDAHTTARALVTADLRGIDSHGVAHLKRYVTALQNGSVHSRPNLRVLQETPSTALLDGDCGLGFVVAQRAMDLAIAKASQAGSGWVVARRSTHYGAAGYWASLALEHNLIGFSLTNATPHVAPTFGAQGMIGTNPIALAVPTGQEPAFLLDMATSVVPIGRMEIYSRTGEPMPMGWVLDSSGADVSDATAGKAALRGRDTFLLPLGGAGTAHSGYKGYGLAHGVEILTSLLAGYAGEITGEPGMEWHMGQFFGALSIEAFRPLAEFTAAMDHRMQELKATPTLPGAERVMVAGQREYERQIDRQRLGIPLHPRVVQELSEVGQMVGVPFAA